MATVNFYLEVTGLREMRVPFERLAVPPGWKTTGRFEKTFAAAYAAVADGVHEITGYLKSSGVPHTGFDGDTWWGEIEYDRYPGIFELARGMTPTQNHPEGEHGFFDNVQPFYARFQENVDQFFRDAFEGGAPI